jgi:hypothetical protein
MAEAARVIQDTGELDASVSALIDQLEPASPAGSADGQLDLTPERAVSQSIDSPADAESEAAAAASDDDLLLSVQALLSEVPVGPATIEAPAESETAAKSEGLELPADFVTPTAAKPTGTIESLDQELAGIADQMISTEVGEEPEAEEQGTLDRAVAAAGKKPQPTEPTLPGPRSESPAPGTKPEQKVEEVKPESPARRRNLLEPALRPVLALCAAASAPLKSKPQHIRDLVAWVALCQLFLGVCVWTYVLFIRSPEAPIPSLLPTKAEGGGEHADAGHGEKKDTHGKKDAHAKADKGGHGKSEPKKDSHAKAEPKKAQPKKGEKKTASAGHH